MDDTSDVTEDVRISNFVIPLRDDDLIEISDAGFYNVSVRPSYNVVEAKIQCFGNKLTFGHEWDLIFRYFDYCFATIKPSFEEDPHDLRFCLLPILQEGLEALLQKIRLFLSKLLTSQPLTDETDQREYLLSALLMYVYLISRVSMELESESIRRQKDTACKDGRRGRKALFERGTDSFMDDWIRIRLKTLDILQRVVGMQCSDAEGRAVRTAIKYLWQPCIVCPSMKRSVFEKLFDQHQVLHRFGLSKRVRRSFIRYKDLLIFMR
ncbi:hypothetical protein AB6A40_004561 [Gnathostoma spinigerum]|uniref:Uncharacterized protein n=1 Tax=Gnathostoma spinigerum TaxID=75299 RepID=A0ABD6EMB1_9BILA